MFVTKALNKVDYITVLKYSHSTLDFHVLHISFYFMSVGMNHQTHFGFQNGI